MLTNCQMAIYADFGEKLELSVQLSLEPSMMETSHFVSQKEGVNWHKTGTHLDLKMSKQNRVLCHTMACFERDLHTLISGEIT